jgi:uncharacterized SAM-binding protein YcdF (DUF218 family)
MDFIVSKLLWSVFAPGNFLLLLLVAGLVWRRVLYVAVILLSLIAVLPIGTWLALPLENRYAPPPSPERVDGIIVLGGAVEADIAAARGQPALNDASERLTSAVILARRFPRARIVFSGGEGTLIPTGYTEAGATVAFLRDMGLPPARLLLEDRARNTWENAVFTRELAKPQPGEVWLLVTSAWHMPRALGCFRRIGWTVLPWPVDYRANPERIRPNFALSEHLTMLTVISKEWVGLAAYWAMGRI